jgi:hypothetical protein
MKFFEWLEFAIPIAWLLFIAYVVIDFYMMSH